MYMYTYTFYIHKRNFTHSYKLTEKNKTPNLSSLKAKQNSISFTRNSHTYNRAVTGPRGRGVTHPLGHGPVDRGHTVGSAPDSPRAQSDTSHSESGPQDPLTRSRFLSHTYECELTLCNDAVTDNCLRGSCTQGLRLQLHTPHPRFGS